MEYEDLDISQIVVGANVRGAYRGEKTHTIPAFGHEPERTLARVFLDTGGGPAAVQVNEQAIEQIKALDVTDDDPLIVSRIGEDQYEVARETGG